MHATYLTGCSTVGISDDEAADKVLGVLADVLPVSLVEDDRALGAFLEQVSEILTAERRVTTEKCVGDDAHGPHVDWLAVALSVHDFGGGIAKRAGHGLQRLLLAIESLGNTKVGKNQVGGGISSDVQQVLGLEICGKVVSLPSGAENIPLGSTHLYGQPDCCAGNRRQ